MLPSLVFNASLASAQRRSTSDETPLPSSAQYSASVAAYDGGYAE